jgi:ribonuclease P protein component
LLRTGRRIRAELFDVKRLDNPLGHVRVAIVVPKFGFTVVRRNKLRRRLRELMRLHVLTQHSSCDLLVRAKPHTFDAPYDRLRAAIQQLAVEIA